MTHCVGPSDVNTFTAVTSWNRLSSTNHLVTNHQSLLLCLVLLISSLLLTSDMESRGRRVDLQPAGGQVYEQFPLRLHDWKYNSAKLGNQWRTNSKQEIQLLLIIICSETSHVTETNYVNVKFILVSLRSVRVHFSSEMRQ